MEQHELDKLVELIATRVKERLGGNLPAAGACSADPASCEACGKCVEKRETDTRNVIQLGAARLASGPGVSGVASDLARYIDHTLLKPEVTRDQLKQLCAEARQYHFYSVCVNSANVKYCKSLLAGSGVKVCAVVGFPLGAMTSSAKAFETREAIRDGAEEIDMVINIGELKSRNYALVLDDIKAVTSVNPNIPVKVILETGMLELEEKVIACVLSKAANARFVKTSTGFGKGGATAEDIALMKRVVGAEMEVKASGGIRDTETAVAMIQAGATRVGASASVGIVLNQKPAKSSGY